MPQWLGIIAFLLALAVLAWLCTGCAARGDSKPAATPGGSIDATDPKLVGMLIGMSGGSITDAAEAQFALRHFEESTGKKATAQDLGFIIGMMSTYEPPHLK